MPDYDEEHRRLKYQEYIDRCESAGLTPMSFFEAWELDADDLYNFRKYIGGEDGGEDDG